MNRGQISNALRKLGLLYPMDRLRFYIEGRKNEKANERFKKEHPHVVLPPDYLMYESFQLNYEKYYLGGKTTAEWVANLISQHTNLSGGRLLDWGCGPGRVVRHMPDILQGETSCFGTDYNADSIEWCQQNIPDVSFHLNSLEAKLPYEDGFFDALYGISIFTHLSEEMHYNWFAELSRIVKPKGVLLFTTQGSNFLPKLSEEEKQRFNEGEIIVRGKVKEGHRTFSAFHPDEFLQKLFGTQVDILDKIVVKPTNSSYIPQDTWILRKK